MIAPAPWSFAQHLARILAPRGEGLASAEECEAAGRAGANGFAADILAWRRSALLMATVVVCIAALVTSVDLVARWAHHARDRSDLGIALDLVFLRAVAPWSVWILCFLALRSWTHLTRSRRLMRIAAAIEVVPAFAIAMLPPAWLMSEVDAQLAAFGSNALRLAVAVGLALRIMGVLSAAFRAAVVTKLIMPESALPGAIVAALTPIKLCMVVVMYVAVNSVAQGWALIGAWLCSVLTQASFLLAGPVLLRPCGPHDVKALFRIPGRAKLVLLPIALMLVLIFFLTDQNSLGRPIINAAWLERHWPVLAALVTNYAVTLVAGTDWIVHGVVGLAARRDDAAVAHDKSLREKAHAIVDAGEQPERGKTSS